MPFLDAYIHVSQDTASPFAAPPPGAAAPGKGDKTLLQLHVPAEHTSLEMGAGATPGIRMVSDRHAHISALSPLTTISLGSAGGKGPLGGPGLSIVTDGDKTEVIKGATKETYNGPSVLTNNSNVEEIVNAAKSVTITGHQSELTKGNLTDQVNGDWHKTCGLWMTETVSGGVTLDYKSLALTVHNDTFENRGGSKVENVGGDYRLTVSGEYTANVTGPHVVHHTDKKIDFCAALQLTATTGLRVSVNESFDVTQNATTWSTTLFDLSKKDIESGKAQVSLTSALLNIFK